MLFLYSKEVDAAGMHLFDPRRIGMGMGKSTVDFGFALRPVKGSSTV